MAPKAETWHYGIVARYWADLITDGGPELEYFRGLIGTYGEPVLDVACGAGRLFVPYLKSGIDIDGTDISPDMLAMCEERARSEGLAPRLFAQASHELDLPRKYRTILVCGSFGIGGYWQHDMEALRRYRDLLEPGGAVAIDVHLDDSLPYLEEEARAKLPVPRKPIPPAEEREVLKDGSQIHTSVRTVSFDPWDLVKTMEMRGLRWRDGELVTDETHTLKIRPYFKSEMLLMLERAGFVDIQMQSGYTGAEAQADDKIIVFIGRKV
jgi:SAM-dependent methyltransferase